MTEDDLRVLTEVWGDALRQAVECAEAVKARLGNGDADGLLFELAEEAGHHGRIVLAISNATTPRE